MKRLIFLLAWAALLASTPASGQFIWIDCSFKAVLNPNTGARYYPFTEADIDATLDQANRYLDAYHHGYRMRRVDPIYDIGGKGDTNGPSKWYWMNPGDPYPNTDHDYQHEMDAQARANPVLYRWNWNAVNYYVLGAGGMLTNASGQQIGWAWGAGSPPPSYIVTLRTVHMPLVLLHETGHWFNLMHTQGNCDNKTGVCGNTNDCSIFKNGFLLGDEGFQDTLPVQAGDYCFTNKDLIALANFALPYFACSDERKNLVNDAFFNLMSYGFDRDLDRLTPQQLDGWTDVANSDRSFAISGLTRYVSSKGNDFFFSGLNSKLPKKTVLEAVSSSNPAGGDVVLLRPGNYNEQFTINRPVTIRAAATNSFPAYTSWATIGVP
jgi:hypothetical protein